MTTPRLSCIKCNSNKYWKVGFYKYMQVYRCKHCKTEFTKLSKSKYSRHRFPKRIILTAVMLYQYGLSSYKIKTILRKRFRVKVSAWTICKWFRKFSNNIRELIRQLGIKFSPIWHADEMYVKALGNWFYLFTVIDSNNNVIALHISKNRDMKSAIHCLRKAKQIAGKPEIIVTDEWLTYPRAIRKVFGWRRKNRVNHVKAHFKKELVIHKGKWYALSNNRIEGWNSWFRPLYRRMRGFKSILSMHKFLDMFVVLYNLRDVAWEFLGSL